MNPTIFALASAPGRAGVAVARLSGPEAGPHAPRLWPGPLPAPRQAVLRRLVHRGVEIDHALLLWFAAPGQLHRRRRGGIPYPWRPGGARGSVFGPFRPWALRPAEPGEFSRRAVENGKLDLTRAEAIADLVDAETPAQLRQALRQHDGALADLYEGWRARLIAALGRAEAAIDFSDDGVGEAEFAAARGAASEISKEIQGHMDDSGRGESLREGLRLTILGPPNAGKSSLINALARRDVAIVCGNPRHHPGCDRSAAQPGRLSAACRRHGGGAGDQRTPSRRKACAALCLMPRAA